LKALGVPACRGERKARRWSVVVIERSDDRSRRRIPKVYIDARETRDCVDATTRGRASHRILDHMVMVKLKRTYHSCDRCLRTRTPWSPRPRTCARSELQEASLSWALPPMSRTARMGRVTSAVRSSHGAGMKRAVGSIRCGGGHHARGRAQSGSQHRERISFSPASGSQPRETRDAGRAHHGVCSGASAACDR
jgi:hypothetical protein